MNTFVISSVFSHHNKENDVYVHSKFWKLGRVEVCSSFPLAFVTLIKHICKTVFSVLNGISFATAVIISCQYLPPTTLCLGKCLWRNDGQPSGQAMGKGIFSPIVSSYKSTYTTHIIWKYFYRNAKGRTTLAQSYTSKLWWIELHTLCSVVTFY